MKLSESLSKAINWLDRDQVVEILERYGFACYDTESTDDLREALKTNVKDGTIDETDIDATQMPPTGESRRRFR